MFRYVEKTFLLQPNVKCWSWHYIFSVMFTMPNIQLVSKLFGNVTGKHLI